MSILRRRPPTSTTLLARLLEAPDLVKTIRGLAPRTFAQLVRQLGVEDAAEVVALATTEQLITAFDEDLFVNDRPGERELFDRDRFVTWLEILLEAGDRLAARRVADLSEDFVVQALSSLILVLDQDALFARMNAGDDAATQADKAIESALSEELDSYLLLSRHHDGWDATLALVLALDRDHRAFLERVLDRCAAVGSRCVDHLDELSSVLSEAESLAEDVEGDRDERRARAGYIEPRAARSFLALARNPVDEGAHEGERDVITRSYFRDLDRSAALARPSYEGARKLASLLEGATEEAPADPSASSAAVAEPAHDAVELIDTTRALADAISILEEREPAMVAERMEELSYLANVILAGAEKDTGRFSPAEAAEAALATVSLGAELEAARRHGSAAHRNATPGELVEVLRQRSADWLFRRASAALATLSRPSCPDGFLRRAHEVALHRDRIEARHADTLAR